MKNSAMKRTLTLLTLILAFLAAPVSASPPPPIPTGFDIYREQITTPQHLDWLWQDYFANRNKDAIEKITSALRLSTYSGALKRAKEIRLKRELSANEKHEGYLDAVFQAAMWSLESNSKQHMPVATELKRIELANRRKTNPSHAYLLLVLCRVAPEEYKLINSNNGFTYATPSGEVRFSISN